jgi:GTPase Era involved in 16S rRNA processing
VPSSALQQFINSVVGYEATQIGHGLKSCTQSIQSVAIRHPADPNRRLILIDTPGFDDTYRPDTEILRNIADWLEDT